MSLLQDALSKIKTIDNSLTPKIQARLDNLTKPQGSLGRLEEFAMRYCLMKNSLEPKLKKKAIFTFAGDHGVADEGVSAFPKEVTSQMVFNFLRGGAGINVIARHVGADVVVVDIGVDHDFTDAAGLIKKKVNKGTKNIAKGPAMSKDEAVKALEVGIELANEYAKKGYDIFGTGDMGIANTTPSSAIVASISGKPVETITGRGTGIDDNGFNNKTAVIKKAIEINKPDKSNPIDVLSKLGGYEIAGIAGLIIGGAANRVPVVVDGFISTAGALIATQLEPKTKDYIFMAHKSVEAGHQAMLDIIGHKPFVDLNLRLGEGTGAALGIGLIECGIKILTEMATFGDAGVSNKV